MDGSAAASRTALPSELLWRPNCLWQSIQSGAHEIADGLDDLILLTRRDLELRRPCNGTGILACIDNTQFGCVVSYW